MTNINILVVDDQHLVRMGLVRMLDDMKGFSVVGEAESGEQALEEVAQLVKLKKIPDVILMDLRMPGIGGLEATRKLTHRYPDIKVIAVTGCSETPFPQRFMECGAVGFITKDSAIEEVALAMRLTALAITALSNACQFAGLLVSMPKIQACGDDGEGSVAAMSSRKNRR